MRSFVLRGAAAVGLAAALLIAGCGGGGGNPGACVSGSPEVCAAGESSDPSRPETSQAWANVCTLDGVKHFTRNYLDEVYLWYREIPPIDACVIHQHRPLLPRPVDAGSWTPAASARTASVSS